MKSSGADACIGFRHSLTQENWLIDEMQLLIAVGKAVGNPEKTSSIECSSSKNGFRHWKRKGTDTTILILR
jgi:hypothetical protein